MNVILLSGGSGKRLWPLSNSIRSKQFIKIIKEENEYVSMFQRVYHQIKKVDPNARITVAASKSQISTIRNQVGIEVAISDEPFRRDTFPAIALATAHLHDVDEVDMNEAVVVCPVDSYVDDSYFLLLKDMYDAALSGEAKLVLMGITPTYPSEKYGYIRMEQRPDGGLDLSFTEKPPADQAKKYIESGALWNGGIFAYELGYVLKKTEEILGTCKYSELYANYENLERISFDYAVVEKENSLKVIRYEGAWKDLGTWNTLTEEMHEDVVGNAVTDNSCEGTRVINELDIPILAMGIKNAVISASPDGILVADLDRSSFIKPYVDKITGPVRIADKSWGTYKVIDIADNSLTIKVSLRARERMFYHSHDRRDEVWTVIDGQGKTIVDGMEQPVRVGDVITMEAGCKHTVIAGEEGLQLIEVQIGSGISVADKKKFEMP